MLFSIMADKNQASKPAKITRWLNVLPASVNVGKSYGQRLAPDVSQSEIKGLFSNVGV